MTTLVPILQLQKATEKSLELLPKPISQEWNQEEIHSSLRPPGGECREHVPGTSHRGGSANSHLQEPKHRLVLVQAPCAPTLTSPS